MTDNIYKRLKVSKIPSQFRPIITTYVEIVQSIDSYNDEYRSDDKEVFHDRPDFMIAGGSFISLLSGKPINDYDIYCKDHKILTEALRLDENYHLIVSTSNASTFVNNSNNKKIQIMTNDDYTNHSSPTDILNCFDFRVCKIGYDGNELIFHENFFEDFGMKKLVLDKLEKPHYTFKRILKYTNKGFNLDGESFKTLLESLKKSTFNINVLPDDFLYNNSYEDY